MTTSASYPETRWHDDSTESETRQLVIDTTVHASRDGPHIMANKTFHKNRCLVRRLKDITSNRMKLSEQKIVLWKQNELHK